MRELSRESGSVAVWERRCSAEPHTRFNQTNLHQTRCYGRGALWKAKAQVGCAMPNRDGAHDRSRVVRVLPARRRRGGHPLQPVRPLQVTSGWIGADAGRRSGSSGRSGGSSAEDLPSEDVDAIVQDALSPQAAALPRIDPSGEPELVLLEPAEARAGALLLRGVTCVTLRCSVRGIRDSALRLNSCNGGEGCLKAEIRRYHPRMHAMVVTHVHACKTCACKVRNACKVCNVCNACHVTST